MIRAFLTIVVPLVVPTGLYLLWITVFAAPRERAIGGWRSVPWLWLGAAGVLFLVIVLFVVAVGFGTRQEGVYVAPAYVNGRIIPGHVEPRSPR
jgi:hypothetical protein